MNDWTTKRKLAICEADDFQTKYDRNGLEMLFYWKSIYPKFKITLFTIPNKTSQEFRKLIMRHSDWIELTVHGWDHDSNYECWGWDYDKTKALMTRVFSTTSVEMLYNGDNGYKKIFKAPGWTITGGPNGEGSGYPLQEQNLLAKDPQAVYKALKDLDFIVFDRHYDKDLRPEGAKIVCVDCNPDIVHMHTWDMVTGDLAGKNGFRQVEELHGTPWNNETEFFFVSEAWEEGLFKECQP